MNLYWLILPAAVLTVSLVPFQAPAEAGPRVTDRTDLLARFAALGTEGTRWSMTGRPTPWL